MKESKEPFVSIVTLVIMFFGVIFAFAVWGVYLGGAIALVWAICTAALFLCECLCGLVKKRFSKNVGAFIAVAVMGIVFAAEYIRTAPGSLSVSTGPDGWGQALACIAFLPPIIVSLIVNICNIVYRLKREKTDRNVKNNLE